MRQSHSPSLASAPFRASLLVLLALVLFIALFWSINQYQSYQQTIRNIERNYIELYKERANEELNNVLNFIDQRRSQAVQRIENNLRLKVQSAYTIASHIYQVHKNDMTPAELRNDVVETLRPIRWDSGRGYYFAGRVQDNIIDLFANDPLLESHNPTKIRGENYRFIFQGLYQILEEKGAGIYHYNAISADEGLHFPGISFVKHFKSLDWYIGAGTSHEVIRTTLQEEILGTIQSMRFSKDGHILCLNRDGTILSHPQNVLMGRSIIDMVNVQGDKYGEEMLQNGLQSAEGAYLFYTNYDQQGKQQRLSFSKAYPDWNWILVVDISMDAMAQAIAYETHAHYKTSIKNGVVFLGLLGIAVLFLLSIAYYHSRKIKNDINLFTDFFRKAAHTQIKIRNKDSTFAEFEDLAALANTMVDDIVQKEHLLHRDELRLDTLLQLSEMEDYSIKDKYDFVLHRITQITDSDRGYLALVNNVGTHCTLCAQIDLQTGYTGETSIENSSFLLNDDSLIGSCVLAGKGVFSNKKKELTGHAYPYREPVQRRIDTPVTDHNAIVLIAGVCNSSREYDNADVRQMTMLLEGLWLHVQKTCSEKEMARLERQVIAIGEEERSRIGRDLHDDLGSHLSGVELLSTVLQKKLGKHAPDQAEQLATIRKLIRDAIEKTRRLSHGLYPVHIIEHGLEASIEELATEIRELFSLTCTLFFADDVEPLDGAVTPHIYYIVREALFNAAKHAKPHMIEIAIQRTNGTLSVTIKDDGKGIAEQKITKGLGLHTMHYRAKAIGATLDISSSIDGGTIVTLQGAIT
jgi:signal transduction histidine kinase